MQTISVQFQPRRSGKLKSAKMCELMLQIALETDVRTFSVEWSRSRDSYLNFLFSSASVTRTWRAIERTALRHRLLGGRIRRSTIVTCQGSRGWDNYRLLYHFDPEQGIDQLAGIDPRAASPVAVSTKSALASKK
jgi:hypothetical protein